VSAIVWFRRDLRLHEHPALRAALGAHTHVVPVFCLDDHLLHGRHASGPRTHFLLEGLADLDESLRKRSSSPVVRHGPPERELAALGEEIGAEELHFTADITPFARQCGVPDLKRTNVKRRRGGHWFEARASGRSAEVLVAVSA